MFCVVSRTVPRTTQACRVLPVLPAHSFHTSSVLEAVPKHRKTAGETRKKNHHLLMKPITTIMKCSNCGQHITLHHACHSCGWHKGQPLTLKAIEKENKKQQGRVDEEVCATLWFLTDDLGCCHNRTKINLYCRFYCFYHSRSCWSASFSFPAAPFFFFSVFSHSAAWRPTQTRNLS